MEWEGGSGHGHELTMCAGITSHHTNDRVIVRLKLQLLSPGKEVIGFRAQQSKVVVQMKS
jgi:hypothetical protein